MNTHRLHSPHQAWHVGLDSLLDPHHPCRELGWDTELSAWRESRLLSWTPHSSSEESGKLSQPAVPTHRTIVEKLGLAVPSPWGPSQPLPMCPSVPLALGSEVLNLVSGPSCPNIWFGGIGFSARYDCSLPSPPPAVPCIPAQDGGDFTLASTCPGPLPPPPGEGDTLSHPGYCCYPLGLFRRQLICFTLAPSLIDQCCNLALC